MSKKGSIRNEPTDENMRNGSYKLFISSGPLKATIVINDRRAIVTRVQAVSGRIRYSDAGTITSRFLLAVR